MTHTDVWERFYWCRSGCNTWHDSEKSTGFHFAMVVSPQGDPVEGNFPGTAEELARMQAWIAIQRADAIVARTAMSKRVDALVATWNEYEPEEKL